LQFTEHRRLTALTDVRKTDDPRLTAIAMSDRCSVFLTSVRADSHLFAANYTKKTKTRGPFGLAGFVVSRSWHTYTSQVIEHYPPRAAESNYLERACPKRDLNPHAVAGIHLRSVRVYQFHHSGTSAKMAKLSKRTRK
jgi:hypothetical protein